jgi:ABC-type polysaccharide/polyol phosphate export permease
MTRSELGASSEATSVRSWITWFIKTDFVPGALAHKSWTSLASRQIKAAYRRSYLGIIWIALSMTITVVALALIYQFLFPVTLSDYLPFLAVSYVTWNLISMSLGSACNVFISNAAYLKQSDMELTIFIISNIVSNVFVFLNHFVVALVIVFLVGRGVDWTVLTLPIGMIIIVWTAFAATLILSPLTCRYRDISQLINSTIQLAFFVTPILWKPEFLSGRFYIAAINPFYHYIELIRAPVIDHAVPWLSYAVTLSISIVLTLLGLWIVAKNRRNIPFWV